MAKRIATIAGAVLLVAGVGVAIPMSWKAASPTATSPLPPSRSSADTSAPRAMTQSATYLSTPLASPDERA